MSEKKKIYQEIKRKTDELFLDLSNIFGSMENIELVNNQKTNSSLLDHLSFLCEYSEVDRLSYQDIEIELKGALVFKIQKKFAETFLIEKIGIASTKEEAVEDFIKATEISFSTKNLLKIESDSCKRYPNVYFSSSLGPFNSYIIGNSLSEEMKKMQIKHFFGSYEPYNRELANFIASKLNHLLRGELTFIQKELNKCFKNKMDWIIKLNNDYILKVAE